MVQPTFIPIVHGRGLSGVDGVGGLFDPIEYVSGVTDGSVPNNKTVLKHTSSQLESLGRFVGGHPILLVSDDRRFPPADRFFTPGRIGQSAALCRVWRISVSRRPLLSTKTVEMATHCGRFSGRRRLCQH